MAQATSIDPQQLTGLKAFDARGDVLGEIQGVYFDAETDEPAWVAVDLTVGGVTLVPFSGSTARDDGLQVAFHSEWVASAPGGHTGAREEVTDDEEAALYSHYGMGATPGVARSEPIRSRGRTPDRSSKAVERAGSVAQTAADEARAVVGTAKEQAAKLTEEASVQARQLIDDTKSRLHSQAVNQTQSLADRVRALADEVVALTEGRPEDAPTASEYVSQASTRLLAAADRLDEVAADVDVNGVGVLIEDVQNFARRRPALFILGATAAGFALGRIVRNRGNEDEREAPSNPKASRQGR